MVVRFILRQALWEITVEKKFPAEDLSSPEGLWQWKEPKRISTYAIDETYCPNSILPSLLNENSEQKFATDFVPHQFCLCKHIPKEEIIKLT